MRNVTTIIETCFIDVIRGSLIRQDLLYILSVLVMILKMKFASFCSPLDMLLPGSCI